MPRKRIALTGATGFVGRAVTRLLAARDHELSILARDPARLDGAIEARVVKGDLFNKTALAELATGCDAVLHLAGAIRALRREGYFAVNRDGTVNLARAALEGGVKRFVHVSSLAAREPQLSPYGASKLAAEEALSSLGGTLATLIVRAPAVYGPGDEATLPLLKLLMSPVAFLPGRREQRFSLIHVDDLAAVLCDAVESGRTGLVEVDDLSGGHNWEGLAALTRAAFGTPRRSLFVPYALAGAAGLAMDGLSAVSGRAHMVSLGKMRELYHPDWVAAGGNWPRPNPIALGEGLPETIRWYQARGKLPRAAAESRSARHD